MNKVRRDFYTCRESDCRDAQPKQLSAEQQNYDADQRANDGDREVHRRILKGHGVDAFVTNACLFDFDAWHKHRYTFAESPIIYRAGGI